MKNKNYIGYLVIVIAFYFQAFVFVELKNNSDGLVYFLFGVIFALLLALGIAMTDKKKETKSRH